MRIAIPKLLSHRFHNASDRRNYVARFWHSRRGSFVKIVENNKKAQILLNCNETCTKFSTNLTLSSIKKFSTIQQQILFEIQYICFSVVM